MRAVFVILLLAVSSIQAQPTAKRPLTHADYDIWNSITGMTLSPDGRFICYSIGPPKGITSS